MSMYRPSEASDTIILRKPIDTVTALEIRGSEDGFSTDRREFTTEEEIRVNGAVTAADGSDLSAATVEIYLDGALQAASPLTFSAGINLYEYSLGAITTEGSHTIRVYFLRYRTFLASQALASLLIPTGFWDWWNARTLIEKAFITVAPIAVIVYLYLSRR